MPSDRRKRNDDEPQHNPAGTSGNDNSRGPGNSDPDDNPVQYLGYQLKGTEEVTTLYGSTHSNEGSTKPKFAPIQIGDVPLVQSGSARSANPAPTDDARTGTSWQHSSIRTPACTFAGVSSNVSFVAGGFNSYLPPSNDGVTTGSSAIRSSSQPR